ncbi:MAG: hypothetical protein FWB86_14430 [Treponema sp.]|nr:hypothetical protein [Treponema sp.]MCL2252434.1 hypothetical protein [Treponema sp.]
MARKLLIILMLTLAVNTVVLADDDNEKSTFPRHILTIDVLPTFGSLLVTTALNDTINLNNYVLFTALQYEYQLTNWVSLASRVGLKHIKSEIDDLEITALSAEAHIRVYPSQGVLFLDWMFGYSYFMMTDRQDHSFLTYGGRLGWRFAFGKNKPGGFILEPSIGYIGALGIKESFANEDEEFKYLVQQYFVGGFVFSVGMGFRF